jgi:hypothetical protein
MVKRVVEADFFRHHRLALGHETGVGVAADGEDGGARVFRRRGPVDLRANLAGAGLEGFEIMIEV